MRILSLSLKISLNLTICTIYVTTNQKILHIVSPISCIINFDWLPTLRKLVAFNWRVWHIPKLNAFRTQQLNQSLNIQYNTVQYSTVPYRTVPYRTIPYRTIPYHTIQYVVSLVPSLQRNQNG